MKILLTSDIRRLGDTVPGGMEPLRCADGIEFRPDMSDQETQKNSPSRENEPSSPEIFATPVARSGGMQLSAWLIAGAVVLAAVAGLLLAGHHTTEEITGIQPLDSYSSSLPLSELKMSESSSLSGGKSTYIDGHIRNTGSSTVAGVLVQVLFQNEEQMPPQVETVPLMLIRTHEPYVDTETVRANPMKPGEDREFRLIFESIPANWNMQMPEVRVIKTEKQ